MSTRVLRWSCAIDDQDHTLPMPPGAVVRADEASSALGRRPTHVDFWAVGPGDEDFWNARIGDAQPAGMDGPGRVFRVFGTGCSVPDGYVHRATTPRTVHGLVWHLFERAEPDRVHLDIASVDPGALVAAVRRAARWASPEGLL